VGLAYAPGSDPRAALDPELAGAARAIGLAVSQRLVAMRPALRAVADDGTEPTVVLAGIDMEPADPGDPITLVACLDAHHAYVVSRGRPDGVSLGALALARILVWAARAEVLGRAPSIGWIGPPARRPDGMGGHLIASDARGAVDGKPCHARAAALVT